MYPVMKWLWETCIIYALYIIYYIHWGEKKRGRENFVVRSDRKMMRRYVEKKNHKCIVFMRMIFSFDVHFWLRFYLFGWFYIWCNAKMLQIYVLMLKLFISIFHNRNTLIPLDWERNKRVKQKRKKEGKEEKWQNKWHRRFVNIFKF